MGLLDIFSHNYPYTDFHELNLDWVIKKVVELDENLKNFINLNTIKYANPILWDITRQYEANTVVVDGATGNAYISVKAVPSGVQINRVEYWTQIYNYQNIIETLREQIATDEGNTTTATKSYSVNDLVFVSGLLYKVISPMIGGDTFVVGSNIEKVDIELLLSQERSARQQTDTQLQTAIDNEVLARENADSLLMTKNNPTFTGLLKTGDTKIFGSSEGHGTTADCVCLTDATPDEPKTDDEPLMRTQMFTNVKRDPSTPWIAQIINQTNVGADSVEKVCTQLNEIFDEKPGTLETIAGIFIGNATGERDETYSQLGDIWGGWFNVKNNGHKSHGIGLEVNCRNTYDHWLDTYNPLNNPPQDFMYCEQVFPDWSTKHLTRGISLQPSNSAGVGYVGFGTGIFVSGYAQRGLFIDSEIEYLDPGTNHVPSDPCGIVFGNKSTHKIGYLLANDDTIHFLHNIEGSFLTVRQTPEYWFTALDNATGNINFANGNLSMHNDGRLNIGSIAGLETPTGHIGGVGISIDESAAPIVIKKSNTGQIAPGVNNLCLKVQAGSNPGTLMLAAYAGTSNVGVVIADNIGGGNT